MRFSLVLLMAVLVPLCAPAQEQKKGGGGPPRNLKILKADEIRPMMRLFTRSLGVRCDYCHVQGDFSSDDNPKKVTARMMITLAHDVNAKFPDGKTHVTCYTCHHGQTMPDVEPPEQPAAAKQ